MDFVDQINKLGKDVYSKTRDMGEIVKLNAAITEQNSQLDRLYQALGREVWQDDDFREVIVKVFPDLSDSIKGCLSRISEYQARIKELKRITKCPACGAENTQDAVFCSGCGRRLAGVENAEDEKGTALPAARSSSFRTLCSAPPVEPNYSPKRAQKARGKSCSAQSAARKIQTEVRPVQIAALVYQHSKLFQIPLAA